MNCGLFSVHVLIEGSRHLLMSQTRALCVENHLEQLGALKYMLEAAGYEVTAATNGEQALRMFTTLDVGIVVGLETSGPGDRHATGFIDFANLRILSRRG